MMKEDGYTLVAGVMTRAL